MKLRRGEIERIVCGRTPHGVRGLKLAWTSWATCTISGRTPHGVRGLKSPVEHSKVAVCDGRTPHGVRGLKSIIPYFCLGQDFVAPHTGCVD